MSFPSLHLLGKLPDLYYKVFLTHFSLSLNLAYVIAIDQCDHSLATMGDVMEVQYSVKVFFEEIIGAKSIMFVASRQEDTLKSHVKLMLMKANKTKDPLRGRKKVHFHSTRSQRRIHECPHYCQDEND
jgi:hypothetical protein